MRDGVPGAVLGVVLALAATPLAGQERFQIYGYLDFEADWSDVSAETRNVSFDLHKFSVLNNFTIDDRWRVFSEFEVEHDFAPTPGESGADVFEIERAFVEYSFSPTLAVRAGLHLTPFGIYNQRHGATPTYLPTFLPQAMYGEHASPTGNVDDMFHDRGTGIEVLGSAPVGSWSSSYSVYVLNGRGENPDEADDNRNKGVGTRLQVRSPVEDVILGLSYYVDTNGEDAGTRQHAIAADVTVRYGGAMVEAEAFVPRMEEVDLGGDPNGEFRTGLAYYAQGSYVLAERYTPFARFEEYDADRDASGDVERTVVAGLNIGLSANAFFKSEIHFRSFPGTGIESNRLVVSSIAVAF
jgi:hypothetical protein